MNKKQTALFWLIRVVIWLIWLALIAIDGLSMGLSWLPWVGIGFLLAWQLDTWFRQDEIGKAVVLLVPYMVLADFVMSFNY
jgi:hypothetical protein